MRKLEPGDLHLLPEYERLRDEFRRRTIELKKERRIQVGPLLSFVFENRDTVLFQVQEMLRAEHVEAPKLIQEELDVYNELLPGRDELSATLFIEVTEEGQLPSEMARLQGLEQSVFIEAAGERIPGVFEEGQAREQELSTVQYVRFHLTPQQVEAFRSGDGSAVLAVYHPNYRERSILPPATRKSLAKDLEEA